MPPQREPRPASDLEEDEQEAFWKSLDEFAGDSSDAPQAPTTAVNSSVGGDDYMWDILDDIETTSTTSKLASVSSAVEVTTIANPSIADDWDDMYL
jgi:replication fork protection complex subunit Csm3/Swi3